jgi:hypothetical protein
MEQCRSTSIPVAFAAQGKPRGRDMSNIQYFVAKVLVIMLQILPKVLQLLQNGSPYHQGMLQSTF